MYKVYDKNVVLEWWKGGGRVKKWDHGRLGIELRLINRKTRHGTCLPISSKRADRELRTRLDPAPLLLHDHRWSLAPGNVYDYLSGEVHSPVIHVEGLLSKMIDLPNKLNNLLVLSFDSRPSRRLPLPPHSLMKQRGNEFKISTRYRSATINKQPQGDACRIEKMRCLL